MHWNDMEWLTDFEFPLGRAREERFYLRIDIAKLPDCNLVKGPVTGEDLPTVVAQAREDWPGAAVVVLAERSQVHREVSTRYEPFNG